MQTLHTTTDINYSRLILPKKKRKRKWKLKQKIRSFHRDEKDKEEKETNGEGSGKEVNNGQETNGEAIQGVNGGPEEKMEEN